MSGRPEIEFLTRRSCSLCDRVHPTVRRLAAGLGYVLRVVDVDLRPDLRAVYGARVPVVRTPRGRVLAEGRIGGGSLAVSLILERLRELFG